GRRAGRAGKPWVTISPARPPERGRRGLTARVVPWTNAAPAPAVRPARPSSVRVPSRTAVTGFDGVLGTLSTPRPPVASSSRTRSVKVPPMSQPSRWVGTGEGLFSGDGPAGRGGRADRHPGG